MNRYNAVISTAAYSGRGETDREADRPGIFLNSSLKSRPGLAGASASLWQTGEGEEGEKEEEECKRRRRRGREGGRSRISREREGE